MILPTKSKESIELRIQNAILEGVLEPGQPVTENWLCNYLDVSRTPVREALIRLESAGLVKIVKNKGAFIQEITPVDISEIFELRILLESHAARVCVNFLDQEKLRGLLAQFQEFDQGERFDPEKTELGYRLHEFIIESTGNRRLKALVAMLNTQIVWVRSFATMVPGRVDRSFREHLDLLEALADKDGLRAGKAMDAHLTRTRDEMLDPDHMRLYQKMRK